MTIAAQDDVAFEKYDYWLSLDATSGDKSAEVAAGQDLARTLALNGFEVARPYSDEDWLYDKSTARRIVYRRHGSNADDANRAISIEETLEELHL